MATQTTHYGLVKQADSDYADNTDLNSNFDKIDNAIYNATARYLPGFTIPTTATWTQLTTANVSSLDPEYLEFDPTLSFPWYWYGGYWAVYEGKRQQAAHLRGFK